MIKGKSKQWHFNKCIEHWQEIVDKKLINKRDSEVYKKYSPRSSCFLCEWYSKNEPDIAQDCPFKRFAYATDYLSTCASGCTKIGSPYDDWVWAKSDKDKYEAAEKMLEFLKKNLGEK